MLRYQSPKAIGTYRFENRIVIHSLGRTRAGFYLACTPFFLITDFTPIGIGQAIVAAIDEFRPEIDLPMNGESLTREFLQGLGVQSFGELQESAICCNLEQYGDHFEFIPTRSVGTRIDPQGFEPMLEQQFSLDRSASREQLGAALMRSFELCRGLDGVP